MNVVNSNVKYWFELAQYDLEAAEGWKELYNWLKQQS